MRSLYDLTLDCCIHLGTEACFKVTCGEWVLQLGEGGVRIYGMAITSEMEHIFILNLCVPLFIDKKRK